MRNLSSCSHFVRFRPRVSLCNFHPLKGFDPSAKIYSNPVRYVKINNVSFLLSKRYKKLIKKNLNDVLDFPCWLEERQFVRCGPKPFAKNPLLCFLMAFA